MKGIEKFVKPELLILVPVLYIIGQGLRHIKFVHKTNIPFIIGALGVILATIYSIASSDLSDYKSVLMCVFVGITQGITCAGLSVYSNQLVVVQPLERKTIPDSENKKRKKKNSSKNKDKDTKNKA